MAAVVAGAEADAINSTPPTGEEVEVEVEVGGDQTMSGPERERMDYELLDALRRGDARLVTRLFLHATEASVVADHAVAIELPDGDNVTEAGHKICRGVTAGGNSALHIVADFGHVELAEFICGRDSSLLAAQNAALETPLHCAARAGADRLLSHFISVAEQSEGVGRLEAVLRATDREGKTALYTAAQGGRAAAARVLMSADPGLAAVLDDKGVSPLYVAVLSRSPDVVQVLLESPLERGEQVRAPAGGATLEASYAGPNGQTALHAAAMVENPEIAGKILQWKPTLVKKADNSGSTPLHYLATTNSGSTLLHYLETTTPLRYLARTTSNIYIVRQLLNHDITQVYLSDVKGLCPIHVAASMGRSDIVRELTKHCPDMDELVDNKGRNFLHVAVMHKRFAIVKFVCQSPSLVRMMNAMDCEGNTPLHLAVKSNNHCILGRLLENRSVHPSIVNKDGKTPLDLAIIQLDYGMTLHQSTNLWIYRCLQGIGAICGPQRPDQLIVENSTQPDLEIELKKYESIARNRVIVSSLIATMAFTLAFSVPGGYKADDHQNGGTPILAGTSTFQTFISTDCAAFVFSITATIMLTRAGSLSVDPPRRIFFIACSEFLMELAVQYMLVALALSLYMVLAPVQSKTDSVALCILCLMPAVYTRLYSWQDDYLLGRVLTRRLGWWRMFNTPIAARPDLAFYALNIDLAYFVPIFGGFILIQLEFLSILLVGVFPEPPLRHYCISHNESFWFCKL